MPGNRNIGPLAEEIAAALTLLADFPGQTRPGAGEEPLQSLLAQCQSLCAATSDPAPLRTLHHFACTGGTLMSKAIAALPGAVLLSEIDPLSRMTIPRPGVRPAFAPTDLILGLRHSVRPVPEAVLTATFLAAVRAMHHSLAEAGLRLILRDHAHSQFCTAARADSRPTLHEMLAGEFALRSVVTLRHPMDSFLSLQSNGWIGFAPATLEEYCLRYLAFLDRHSALPRIRYEDFTADPEAVLAQICGLLDLPFSPLALDLLDTVRISGDSGRSSVRIVQHPPKAVPADLGAQRGGDAYVRLCAFGDYDPLGNPIAP